MAQKRLQIGGICRVGHTLTPENIYWREGKANNKYIECVTCAQGRKRKYVSTERHVRPDRVQHRRVYMQEYDRRRRLEPRILADDTKLVEDMAAKFPQYDWDRPSSPTQVLKAKAPDEFTALNDALENYRSPCFGQTSVYVDYEEIPTPAQARLACAGCKVLDLCRAWAEAEKPAWGLAGGQAWDSGKVVA